MKEIKAFVHRGRIGDIVRSLREKGHLRLTVIDVSGLLEAVNSQELRYSIELGERVIHEVRLDLVCEDNEVAGAVQIIRERGYSGQRIGGWVYVCPIEAMWPIDGRPQ